MSKEYCLSNGLLKVVISAMGAEPTSIKKYDEEYLWQGDPDGWNSHAPLLFPVVGQLKDNKFMYEGNEYNPGFHGYARFTEFGAESHSMQKLVLLHRYNEETFKRFPFKYELRVIYTLNDSSLKIDYSVKNLDAEKMYFSIGSHEGYSCPEGIEEYSVIFEKSENLDYIICSGGLLGYDTSNIGRNISELPLKYKYFEDGALTFLNLNSRKFALVNRNTGKTVEIKIDDNQTVFTLWTRHTGKYICLEPWCGMSDYFDTDYNIKTKKGIVVLQGCEEKTISHEICFK